MSFWSSQTIKHRLKNLVDPYDEENISSASYELSLGGEVYISPLPDTSLKERKKILIKDNETVAIPPGQFAFLITHEKVYIPQNAIAFISMKFAVKAHGLINVSGFHVDPGYKGNLIFAIYNAGPLNYQLEYRQKLFSIWFADLDASDSKPRSKEGFKSIPTEFLNTPDLVSSLPYLVKRLDDLEKKVESYSVKQAIFYGVAISLALTVTATLVKPLIESKIPPSGYLPGLSKPN